MESGRMGRVWQFPYFTNSKVWEICPYINDRHLDIIMVGVGKGAKVVKCYLFCLYALNITV